MATILIVEDNPDIAILYQRLCNIHDTLTVGNPEEAIEYLRSNRPNLVILDFHLAGGEGLDVLDFVRGQEAIADTPIVGISADDMLRSEAKQRGINAFLPKPIDLDEFYLVTNQFLPQ